MNFRHKDYKLVLIYINESQKRWLEELLDAEKYVMYSVQTGLEAAWSEHEKHMNNKIWPGKECIFRILVRETKLEALLGKLRGFRLTLPQGVIMAAGVVALEGLIVDFINEDIEYDPAQVAEWKDKHRR
ncbi:MAG: hypothetical protein LBQ97_06945 [Fusobacteriaceae bacterium]|jgi:hypothetical protein|nr:hypothetical protein [Fusobacteriaceae bacterium]